MYIPDSFPTLWYENADGEKHIPDLQGSPCDLPDGFVYQHSMFPAVLRENVLELIQRQDVDACKHPRKNIIPTYGWVDGVEGRRCTRCGGTQIREVGKTWLSRLFARWPRKWDAHGSRQIFSGSSTWSEDLVLAMTNSGDFTLSKAILVAARACERCSNALGHQYGLEWGYPEYGDEWKACGTSCAFCTNNAPGQ